MVLSGAGKRKCSFTAVGPMLESKEQGAAHRKVVIACEELRFSIVKSSPSVHPRANIKYINKVALHCLCSL